MNATIDKLPAYLQKYCVAQTSDKYSARDHAAWRYIMRQSRTFFKDHAVPIYLEGLKRTGISLDRIPLIDDMDAKLKQLGWGAVPVCGFIPPAAFLDFQARRILPIAYDMRSVDHIAYTPAPDIVHEAAGHAPILADEAYSNYLTMYAGMAQKAIFSREDMDLYEAIRALSDIKENPDSTPSMIHAAEAKVEQAAAAITMVSEANRVARMNWWTVEYGLLGSLKDPKIYGAGLLSSVGESQACLSDKVLKLRLSIDCVHTSYNITEPQPQLFVADSIDHLCSVLKEFEQTLSYVRGGLYGLTQAQKGRTVTTCELDSTIQTSGILSDFLAKGDDPIFLRYSGPVQISINGVELAKQGTAQHPNGFSSPIGRWQAAVHKDPSRFTPAELEAMGIRAGQQARLEFTSGFSVSGRVAQILHSESTGRLVLIKWQDCTVAYQGELYFEPSWGDFDMLVGTQVSSVFGGPADREAYGSHDFGQATTSPGRTSPYTPAELAAIERYEQIRHERTHLTQSTKDLQADTQQCEALIAQAEALARDYPHEWLLRLESLELAYLAKPNEKQAIRLRILQQALTQDHQHAKDDIKWLIAQGINLVAIPD